MPEPKKDELKILVSAYKSVFSGDNGRLVLEDLKQRGFFNTTTWAQDRDQTLINEGSRRLVLHINTMVEFDLKDIEKIQEEQSKEEKF